MTGLHVLSSEAPAFMKRVLHLHVNITSL